MPYTFCPQCAGHLTPREDGLAHCPCGFVHYDNPVPVVATLVPVEGKILLVQRGAPPFVGCWCLPRGHIDRYEHPKAAACREVREETGLNVRVEKLLSVCNPSPKDFPLNVLSIFYLARVVDECGGQVASGSDSMATGFFSRDELPDLCFRSDKMIINEWYLGTWGEITGKDLLVSGNYD